MNVQYGCFTFMCFTTGLDVIEGPQSNICGENIFTTKSPDTKTLDTEDTEIQVSESRHATPETGHRDICMIQIQSYN